MPKASLFAEDLHPTVFDKAAAYLFHLECNHPFLDGNKRTGTITALTFLGQNGIYIKFSALCKARRPKYEYYHEELKKKYGAKNLGDAPWALMTPDVIPGSRKKSFA